MIDGVRVSIVDRVDVSATPIDAMGVTERDGMRVMFMDSPAPESQEQDQEQAAPSGDINLDSLVWEDVVEEGEEWSGNDSSPTSSDPDL